MIFKRVDHVLPKEGYLVLLYSNAVLQEVPFYRVGHLWESDYDVCDNIRIHADDKWCYFSDLEELIK